MEINMPIKEPISKFSSYKRPGGIISFFENNNDLYSFKLYLPLYREFLKILCNFVNSAHKDTNLSALVQNGLLVHKLQKKKKNQPWFLVESLKLVYQRYFG